MGFFFSQKKYIQYLLDQSSLTDHWIVETPIEHNVHLRATNGEPLDDASRYHHTVESLIYLGVTRPNLSYFELVCL
jgi:hypothetical protein